MSKEILQPIFDKVTAAIIAQGEPAIHGLVDNPSCAYRVIVNTNESQKTLKCAIGQILSDEQILRYSISPGMVPYEFPDALVRELVPGVETYHAMEFLKQLQGAHDNAAFAKTDFLTGFVDRSNFLAAQFNLDPIKP